MAFSPARTVLQDISSSPLVSRAVDSESNIVLIPSSFLTPSPEEQIIRQRSQRQRHVVQPHRLYFHREESMETPPKINYHLLTQSRKRLLMTPPTSASTPAKDVPFGNRPKKIRLHRRSVTPPLDVKLSAYTTQQLVGVIDRLCTSHPELEQEVRRTMPVPDIKPLEANLANLRRQIYRAFPSERWGSSRDAYCYKRVKLHLVAFKKACIEQGRMLLKAKCWEPAIRYILSSWRLVQQLPSWDDPSHNDLKARCFHLLAAQAMLALQKSPLEKERYRDIRLRLKVYSAVNKEMEPCVKLVDALLEKLS